MFSCLFNFSLSGQFREVNKISLVFVFLNALQNIKEVYIFNEIRRNVLAVNTKNLAQQGCIS